VDHATSTFFLSFSRNSATNLPLVVSHHNSMKNPIVKTKKMLKAATPPSTPKDLISMYEIPRGERPLQETQLFLSNLPPAFESYN
jgi:hypothetical protein